MNEKNVIKEVIIKNKAIFFLFILLVLIGIGSGVTAQIPSNKLDNANDINVKLNSEKESAIALNGNLENELKSVEKTQAKIEKKLEKVQSDSFEVVIGSKWKGTYTASQGETELILEINEHNAVFNFGPTGENQDIAKGSYYMGKNVIDQQTGYIELLYTEWSEDPGSYSMLNLHGVAKGKYMTGILTDSRNNKIGEFKVEKVD